MSTHVPDRAKAGAKTLLDSEAIARTLSRIAHEMIERNDDLGRLALVGIHTRGVPLAERLAALIEERSGEEIALGAVDITFHRDDTVAGQEQPVVHATALDFDLSGTTCVLVDDVLYTGRTIRAVIIHAKAAMRNTSTSQPYCRKAGLMMAMSRNEGITSSRSTPHSSTRSTQPPK